MMNKMIAIPAKDAIEYGENTNAMFSLLSELRELLMTETRLKKHHRPYLHLREQIDEKVKEIAPVLTKVAVDMLALRCSAVSVEDDVDCAGCICEDCEEDCRMCKDSPCYDGDSEDLEDEEDIPLQNMINALYSKDISRKVSTALKAQMEQGTFRKRNLPYGYRWDEARSNMVIDEEVAQYVRLMFQWKIEGRSIPTILDELDRLGAPNTELRKRQTGTRTGDGCSCKGWSSSTLYGILTNPHYVGDTVLGRSMKAIYKGIKSHNVKDKDEWIVFPNTHEPIISREDFQKVQDIITAASQARQSKMKQSAAIRATLINLFEGKIICADCGRKMYYHRKKIDKDKRGAWYAFYECSGSVNRRYDPCTTHYIRQDTLEVNVLAAIQLQVKAALDYDRLLDKLRGSEGEKDIRDRLNAQITSLNLKLSGLSKKRTRLYEDYAEGLLDEEEYTFAKKSYDEQYADYSRRLDEAVQRRSKFSEAMSVDNKWITLMKSVSSATQLSKDLVDESVELVKVHENGAVELVMKYGDLYALTVQSIKEVQEAM